MIIKDLNDYPTNERNGTYGGNAGDKEGISINGEYWIVKYPKNTKGMRGNLPSYTSSPLSEYIGSNIYDILGLETHKTLLGFRNNKIVVACKDFCKNEGSLREIRTLKNIYNKELEELLNNSFSSTSDSHLVDIDTMLLQLSYNPVLNKVPDIEERFWDMFVIDIFINNNDRNNGNWGLIYENNHYRLAPVFDNGAAFSPKLPDSKLEVYLSSSQKMIDSINGCTTVYSKNGKIISAKDIKDLEYSGLIKALERNIPAIKDKMNDIKEFITFIPSEYNDLIVCSDTRKKFYCDSMELKLERFLIPALKNNKTFFESTATDDDILDLTGGFSNIRR